LEPANWAKLDIVEYVEKERIWRVKKADIDKKFKEARDLSEKIFWGLSNTDPEFYPGKYSGLYWFEEERRKNPNNPFSIAKENEIAIEHERDQLYHQFNKETPEEKVEELLGRLLLIGMMGIEGEAALAGEGEAALASLGEAETALAVGESEAALTSVIEARAALIAAEEYEAALIAVEEARTALVAEEIEAAAAAVEDAQAALLETVKGNPAAVLALTAMSVAEAKLDSVEKADSILGITEMAKIDQYAQFDGSQDDELKFLGDDYRVAIDYVSQYRDFIAQGKIIPTKGGDKVMRKGCKCIQ